MLSMRRRQAAALHYGCPIPDHLSRGRSLATVVLVGGLLLWWRLGSGNLSSDAHAYSSARRQAFWAWEPGGEGFT
jgi:hypothetical protein